MVVDWRMTLRGKASGGRFRAGRCRAAARALRIAVAWSVVWHLAGAAASPAEAPADWKFDVLEMKDGRTHRGLVLAEGEEEIEFAEIVRPPGKSMFAVIRPVSPDRVAKKQKLTEPERAKLWARFQQFRNRARIEAGRMEDVPLRKTERNGTVRWAYDGPWFQLESTADESMVRRCVVRAEQIFRAYRQTLPPQRDHRTGMRVVIFGSMDEYLQHLRDAGLQITAPACYSAVQNLVLAGGELNTFSRRLEQTQAQNEEVRRQYRALKSSFSDRLSGLIQQMKERGFSAAQIEQEVKLRSAAWQREYNEALSRLEAARVQNEAAFLTVTDRMFAQLYHEAFHAYVENYVCPQPDVTLPLWLNEGLAQIFEVGHIEGDSLRIDAPDRQRLAQLQKDLRDEQPLKLADVVTASEQNFLEPSSSRAAQRYYLYSWGLAYFLTFEKNLLRSDTFESFLANVENFGPAARFTRLVDMPIAKFERLWSDAILAL